MKKFKINLAPKINFTLEKLINYKFNDKEVNSNKSGIYSTPITRDTRTHDDDDKIKCKDCEGCYIGQTSRNLETRYKEYMRRDKIKN